MARDPKAAPDKADSRAAPGYLEGSGEKPVNFAADETSPAYKEAAKLYPLIQKVYENRQQANDDIEEYWSIANAQPDDNIQYSGNSQCYVPAVRDALKARRKRALRQLFPSKYKHVEVVGDEAEKPWAQMALIEHYIRSTRLKEIVQSDLIAGDVTGQWCLMIDWEQRFRRITKLVKRNPFIESDEAIEGLARKSAQGDSFGGEQLLPDPTDEEETTEEEDIKEQGPEIIDVAVEDLAVVPPTCNDIEKSRASCVRLRMSAEKVQEMIEEGVFLEPKGENLKDWIAGKISQNDQTKDKPVPPKQRTHDAGIRTEGTYKYLLVYFAEAVLEVPDREDKGRSVKKLCQIFYASKDEILGIIEAPQWNGKRSVISGSIERVAGSFYGKSVIDPVKFLQWNLNDFWNMGQDSAMYSLLPITMTDPYSNPVYASMVMGLAAVWLTDPNKTKITNFPQLYKDSFVVCDNMKRQIWESLEVNEMMMGRMPAGRKNNQLMGQFQQDQMVNTIDLAERYEEVILSPLAERLLEYDAQFRVDEITILSKGEIGAKAMLTRIPPQQWGERYSVVWSGTAFMQGMQLAQQRVALMNVLRGVPPQQLGKKRIDITPILESITEQLFGPEVAPRIIVDESNLFTIPPEVENEILANGMPVDVHAADNDVEHIQAHQQAAQATKDLSGKFRAHIARHIMQLQAKRQAQSSQQQGAQGVPGGAAKGVPGSPRPGAQPAPQRPAQQPPGAVQDDNMPGGMPRG